MATVAELAVEVDGEDKGAKALLAELDAMIREFDGRDVTIETRAGSDEASENLRELERQIEEIDGSEPEISPQVEGQEALFELEEVRRVAEEVDSLDPEIPVDVDASLANAQLQEVAAAAQAVDAIDPNVEVETPGYDAVSGRLADLQNQVDELQNSHIDIQSDADIARSLANIRLLENQLRNLERESFRAEIDVDTVGNIAQIELMRVALRQLRDDIRVVNDTDVSRVETALARLGTVSQRASTNIRAVTTAILALGPALIPLGGVLLAGIGGIAPAFVAAGFAAGIFGAAAVTAISPIAKKIEAITDAMEDYEKALTSEDKKKALEEMRLAYEALDPMQRQVADSFFNLRATWKGFVSEFEPEILFLAVDAMDALSAAIPRFKPLMDGAVTAMENLHKAAVAALKGPFWQEFFNNLSTVGGPALESFGRSIGNLITGFAGILNAFMPFTLQFTGGFEAMTKSFADWGVALGDSEGFKSFMEYARETTPQVIEFIKQLWNALVNLVVALAPLGGAVLTGVTSLLGGLSSLAETHPGLVRVGMAAAAIFAVLMNLIGPLVNIGLAIRMLGTVFSAFGEILAGVGITINTGAIASFLGWAAAIVAAIGALVMAYKHMEKFRDAVDELFQKLKDMGSSIMSAIQPAIDAVVGFFQEQVQKVRDWYSQNEEALTSSWERIRDGIEAALTLIVKAITFHLDLVLAVWNTIWPGLSQVLGGVWTIIKGIISGALDIILGIISVFAGILGGNWGTAWNGLVQILTGVWEVIWGVLKGAWQILVGIMTAIGDSIAAVWSLIWDPLMAVVRTVINAVVDGFQWLYDFLVGNSIIPDLVNAIIEWFNRLGSFIAGFFGPIISGIQTAWQGVLAVTQVVWQAIVTVVQLAWQGITTLISAAIAVIQAIWNTGWNLLVTVLQTIWQAIVTTVTTAFNGIVTLVTGFIALVRAAWSVFWDFVSEYVTRVLGLVTAAVGAFIGWFTGAWSTAWETAKQLVSDAWNAIYDAISTFISTIIDVISSFVETGLSIWRGLWDNFSQAVSDGATKVLEFVRGMLSDVVSAITDFAGRLYDKGAEMIRNFADGIRSAAGAVQDAVGSVIDKASGVLPGSPAEEGPLSGQGYVLLRGQRFMQDLARGLGDTAELEGAVAKVAEAMSLDFATTGPPPLGDPATLAGAALSGASGAVSIVVSPGAVAIDARGNASAADIGARLESAGVTLAQQLRDAFQKR